MKQLYQYLKKLSHDAKRYRVKVYERERGDDSLSARAAALVADCLSDTDPLSPLDDRHSFAPAEAVARLFTWAAAADALHGAGGAPRP